MERIKLECEVCEISESINSCKEETIKWSKHNRIKQIITENCRGKKDLQLTRRHQNERRLGRGLKLSMKKKVLCCHERGKMELSNSPKLFLSLEMK